jgi:glycosyltransferase involved in cell wall biosynthesis
MRPERRLRVAYVAGSLDIGGAERQMLALAERLPRDRFTVEFVLLARRGMLAPAAEAAGARVRVVGWPRSGGLLHGLRWLVNVARFCRIARGGRYDIADAWMFQSYEVAALTRPVSRIPVLISGRRDLSDYKAEFRPFDRVMDVLARRRTDGIVANSEAVRADVARREGIAPERIRVIHNGVEIPPPMPPEEREALRTNWGFGPDDVVVGSVANYKPRKGLESLLRTAGMLRADLPQLRFVLVGEGSLRPELERMIGELGLSATVRLHGREPDARRLYGAFDVVAHVSESEGLPNVLLEAAAAGRAIVATPAGGSAEVIVDGESGMLVPIGDAVALAQTIRRLALDPALRERLGAAARERAASVFGMDRFVAETAALYEELAARKGVRR